MPFLEIDKWIIEIEEKKKEITILGIDLDRHI